MSDENGPEQPSLGYWQVGMTTHDRTVHLLRMEGDGKPEIHSAMDAETALGLGIELMLAARAVQGHGVPSFDQEGPL